MSNTWVIYLRVGDNPRKLGLIPHNIIESLGLMIKAGDLRTWRLKRSPRPISLLVG